MDPTFALTFDEIKQKFQGENKISKDSTLVLIGKDTKVKDLNLDGTARA